METEDRINFVKVAEITKDQKSASIMARVCNFSKIIDFDRKDGSKGKVVNVYLNDGTGSIRLVLWDRQVAAVDEERIKIGDVIQIVNATVRESLFDAGLDVVPGRYTSVNLVEEGNHNMPTLEEINKRFIATSVSRQEIKNLVPGIFEVRGTVVQVVKGKYLFYTCSLCGSKMMNDGTSMKCLEHGDATPQPEIVFNTVLDDGTDNIRSVFFRSVAENILGMDTDSFASMNDDEKLKLIEQKLLGNEFIITGKVKRNEMFDRKELIVSKIENLNALEESKRLVEDIERVGSDG